MSRDLINLIVEATGESLFMVSVAASLATLFGLPIGIFLATSRKGELFAAPSVNTILGVIVNATRSTPFVILAAHALQGLFAGAGLSFKRSHLVALRHRKISASNPPSTWWPGER